MGEHHGTRSMKWGVACDCGPQFLLRCYSSLHIYSLYFTLITCTAPHHMVPYTITPYLLHICFPPFLFHLFALKINTFFFDYPQTQTLSIPSSSSYTKQSLSQISMVKRFSMESQDMRMCKTEAVFSGVTVDYNNTHRLYDEDCFGDILNMLDFPMESLEVDGFAEDWESKLGPIPSEVFKEVMPPPGSQAGGGNNYVDLPLDYPVPNDTTCHVKASQLKQQTTSVAGKNPHSSSQASFEAPSPNSVLESRTSSSNNKGVSFGIEISIPVRTRSKRLRPATNTWLLSPFILLPNQGKKRKEPSQIPVTIDRTGPRNATGIKKCAHCEITKTPQWREGPSGPKTLCNACGVRYRSGRLYPEYRPAASPTFIPALHSNSHRKVIEMRQKVV